VINGTDSRVHGAIALHLLLVELLVAVVLMPASPPARASQADAERGVEIVREMNTRDRGIGDSAATLKLVLIDASGDETLRELRTKTLEGRRVVFCSQRCQERFFEKPAAYAA